MKIKKYGIVLLIFFLFGVVFSFAKDFSADFISYGKDKSTEVKGKYYMSDKKIRQEMSEGGEKQIIIIRMDKKLVWNVMSSKMYVETPYTFDITREPENIKYIKKNLGKEKMNGYDCDVVEYVYEEDKYGILKQWYSSDLEFAVKNEVYDSKRKLINTFEYKNIKEGKQSDSLFEIPSGYQKLDMPNVDMSMFMN